MELHSDRETEGISTVRSDPQTAVDVTRMFLG